MTFHKTVIREALLPYLNRKKDVMKMSVIIGILIGAVIGGAIGYFGRCAGST